MVHFVITGGTIDSFYNPIKDSVDPSDKSVIPEFVETLKLYCSTHFSVVCLKDSRTLTRDYLNDVLRVIEESSATKIIVTHGTYTMPDTARFLKAQLTRRDQAIILTGSMIPLKGFAPSDAPFNLGYALAKVQDIDPGVYLCMNGAVFSPDEVAKMISEGRFVSLSLATS